MDQPDAYSTVMKSSQDVVEMDIDLLTSQLSDELAALSGRDLLIAGGAGFLGLLPRPGALALEQTDNLGSPHPRHRPGQLHPRRPAGSPRSKADPHLRLLQHDITQPLPAELGDHRVPGACRVDCLADILPEATRSRRWMRTSTGCAFSWNIAWPRSKGQARRGRAVLLEQRDLRRPDAGEHSDPGDLPRQRVLHRTSCLLRRVEAIWRDPMRELRPPARPADQGRAAVQQLRARG